MSSTPRLASAPLLLFALLAACAGPRPVSLSEAWPGEPRAYQAATRDWTRSGKVSANYSLVARVHATFKSSEWRAAYLAQRRRQEALSDKQYDQLVGEHKAAMAEYYEVELLVATHEPRDNDLDRGARSTWRLTLINDRGEEVTAAKIERDRRPATTIRAQFPAMGDFERAYVVGFPRDIELMHEGSAHFIVRMAGARGKIDLVWRGK